MSKTNQICITCTQRDTCQYYDQNRTICVPVMTEQEMQQQIAIEQGKVNALRQEVADMNKEREYWQHYRIQAAIANQQAILSNYDYFSQGIRVECNEHEKKRTQVIAEMAVELADALIAELQKKQD